MCNYCFVVVYYFCCYFLFVSALESLYKKRTVVISRSTFPGSGTRCGHWLGDNASQWPHIRQSIPGKINNNVINSRQGLTFCI